jgi:hypothetical protein
MCEINGTCNTYKEGLDGRGMGNEKCIHNFKAEGKRSSHRSEDNFKIDFKELGWEGVIWMQLAQDRVQ